MARFLKNVPAICLGLLAAMGARAEYLPDPTRPALSAEALESGPAASVGKGLNVVVVREGDSFALIGKRAVRIGDHIEQGTIVAIRADALIVRDADGKLHEMALYPGVEIKPVAEAAQSAPVGRRRR